MLEQTLISLGAMRLPENAEVSFLVVENDLSARSEGLILEARSRLGLPGLHYLLESNVGIPMARNRGAMFSVQNGADLLAFIDDDEAADENWLLALVLAYRASGALLLGGPVLSSPPKEALRGIEPFMYRLVSRRSHIKARRAEANATRGKHGKVTITTGNWMASVDLFTLHGLRFDESMRVSGGSDAAFFAELRRRKLAVRWVPEAVVHETVPRQRLLPSYQFRRAYGQSISSFGRKLDRSWMHLLTLPATVPLRSLAILVLLLAMPLTRGTTFLTALRSAGWVAGRVSAALGGRSKLYAEKNVGD